MTPVRKISASAAPAAPRATAPAAADAPGDAPARSSAPSLAPLADALSTVGDRWSLLLVASLLDGPRRFGELQQALEGIAPNVLSQRLRQLEQRGLVLAQPYSRRPPRYLYELTESGHQLAGTLRLLADWGARHGEADAAEAPRHSACGTPLEARWYCPTCQEPAEPAEDGELYYA